MNGIQVWRCIQRHSVAGEAETATLTVLSSQSAAELAGVDLQVGAGAGQLQERAVAGARVQAARLRTARLELIKVQPGEINQASLGLNTYSAYRLNRFNPRTGGGLSQPGTGGGADINPLP